MPRLGKVKPTCHPDLPHRARGLCQKCYYFLRTVPSREISRDSFLDERNFIPLRTPLKQRAVTAFPLPECPKCHGHNLIYEGRQARCFTCGYDVWLVREALMA